MPALTPTRNTFSGGEWSPTLWGRWDHTKYATACRTMRNWFVRPHGSASNRGGTYFIGEVRDSTEPVRLIPFQFSVVQTYMLVLNDGYMQVVNGYGFVTLTGSRVEFAIPWAAADLADLQYAQTADTIYVVHPSYAPRKITRTSDTAWTITTVSFGPTQAAPTSPVGAGTDNNYVITAIGADGEESVPTSAFQSGNTGAITWTAASGAVSYRVYKDTKKLTGIYGWVADTVSASWTDSSVLEDPEDTAPLSKNPFSGTGNYPGSVAFFQGRLFYARTNNKPDTIWGSQVWHYDNFNRSHALRDDDAMEWHLTSSSLNAITFLVPLDQLLVGSGGCEWRVDSGSSTDAITPTSVSARVQSAWGSAWMMPVVVGNTVMMLLYGDNIVRDLAYSLQVDGYDGQDRTILARHLFDGHTITTMAYQRQPDSVLWCTRDDGVLLGLTFYKEQEVIAWHQHDTDGSFEGVACVPSGDGDDVLYLVVQRVVSGSVQRYVERLEKRLPTTDIQDAFFVDCGLSLDSPIQIQGITQADPAVVHTISAHGFTAGDLIDVSGIEGMTELNGYRFIASDVTSNELTLTYIDVADKVDSTSYNAYTGGGYLRKAVTSISGLAHLEGKEVAVLANGSVVPGLTVASGAITLPYAASRVHVGLPYVCDLETLDFEFTYQAQTTQDKRRRISSAVIHLQDTRALRIGPDEDHLTEMLFRDVATLAGWPEPMFTGEREQELFSGDADDSRIFMRVQEPLPATVLAIIPRLSVGGVQ